MSQQLFLQKDINNTHFAFLINSTEAWDRFQRSSNPRKAVIDYYQELLPLSGSKGNPLSYSVEQWKVIAKTLKCDIYINYPHISRLLPSVPPKVKSFEERIQDVRKVLHHA